jgi:hypothetical protein
MALNPQLERLRSAGIYHFEYDKSEVINTNNDLTRLIVGFSKKGPFNTPIYIPNTEIFYDIFGTIDKSLERKKSYFHRTCLTALERGPIIALNLLRLDEENDVVDNFIFSTSSTETNIGLNSKPYSGYYNTEKFWTPDDESFLNNISSEQTSNRLFNLVNIGQKPISVIVRKTPIEDLAGFQVTAKEWYGVEDLPEYLHENDLISDFFIDVVLIGGDFGPGTDSSEPYSRFATDPLFGKYFDRVKGVQRKLLASDTTDTSMNEFLNLNEVNNIATYRGTLLPDFVDKNDNNLFIETLINRESAKTGLFSAINKDVYTNGELLSGMDGGLDLIGHNLEYAQPKVIDFLSYKDTVKSDLEYAKTLAVTSTLDLTDVTISENSNGNVTFAITKATNETSYDLASTFVSNELLPRVIGTYALSEDGGLFGAVINVIRTETQLYFEIDGLAQSDFATATELKFVNPDDLDFVYDDTFTSGVDTVGKIVGVYGSEIYDDALNGILTNGDKIFYGTGGSTPGYLAFEFRSDFDMIVHDVAGAETQTNLTVTNYTLPIVNVTAFETNDMLTYINSFGFSLTYYDSDGVAGAADTLIVQTLKGALNQTIPVTTTSLATEVEVDLSYSSKISNTDYLVSDDGTISGNSRLTKISKITNQGTKLLVQTYGPISVKNVNGQDTIEVYKPVTEWVDYYSVIALDGFSHSSYHLPDGSNTQQNNILYDTLSGTSLYKALIDKENINYRYLVDTFGNGIEGGSKAILAKMAKDKTDCLAILNAPSYKEFRNSTDPSFVDLDGSVDARYIVEGGDLSKNPETIYSLPTIVQGSNYSAFFGPYIKVNDNGRTIIVPPAGYVSNLFIDKHETALPWSIVAGSRRGVVSGRGVVGVETNLSKEDRDYLEPFGWNPIIYQSGVGIMVYGNKTAQQNIKSALSSTHVREVLIEIQKGIESILKYFIFEFNTAATRLQIKSLADNFLSRIKQSDGVFDFKTIMDETNNTNEVIDKNMGILDIYVEPVRGLEILVSRTTILRTGGVATGDFV